MKWNLKQADENNVASFDALPRGRYNLEAVDSNVEMSKTNKEMIAVEFRVTAGKYANRKGWHRFTMTDKAIVFLVQFLRAAKNDILESEDVSTEEIAKSIVGNEVSAFTKPDRTPNGNPKNEWSEWKAVMTEEQVEEMESLADEAEEVDTSFPPVDDEEAPSKNKLFG